MSALSALRWIPALLPALFPLAPALAESTTVLEEVVVSGSRETTPLAETPSAIGKVDGQTLKDTKATDITQTVNQVPGVYMADLGNEQHSMSIRQPITTNAVYQYLEDGIPIRPVGIFNHNALNEVNLTAAGEVEVLRGPSSSLYGSNAVGGAVNFLSQVPSASPEALLSYQQSSEGYRRLDTGASDTYGSLGLRFSHYSARLRDSWRQYNEMDKDALSLRTDYALSESSLIKLLYSHSKLDTDTPGSLNETDYHTQPYISYQTFTYRRDQANRLSATFEQESGRAALTSLTLYARNNEHAQLPNYQIRSCTVSPACPTGYAGKINENRYDSLGLDTRHRHDFALLNTRWIVGLTYDRSPNDYVEDRLDITRDTSNVYTSYSISTRNREYDVLLTNLSAYSQLELSPVQPLRIVLGGRYDTIEYDFNNHLVPSATTGAPSEVRDFDHFSPKAGATWALTPATSLYANYAQGFTPPEVSALYARLVTPDLRAATFNNYELGVRSAFAGKRGMLDASLYRLKGEDEIVNYTIAVGNSEPRNAGRTLHTGLEFGTHYELSDQWDARLSTAFARHEYTDYDASPTLNYDGKIIKGSPENISRAELAYRPLTGLRIGLEVFHLSEYWMNDANTVKYPGHTLLNLRVAYRQGAWEGWLKLMNIADEQYATTASSSYSGTGTYTPDSQNSYTPGEPRTLWLGVAYRFGAAPK